MRIFRIELKKGIKKIIPVYLVFLVLSMVITQKGINKIKYRYQEEKEFKKIETQLLKGYLSYHQYGVYGVRYKLSAIAMGGLFSESAPFMNLTAFIDVGIRLYLYNEVSDDNAIDQKGYLDLHWVLKILGSLLILIWCWKTFQDKEYLKFLISKYGRSVKKEILMARIATIFMGILVLYGQIQIQFLINRYSIEALSLGFYLGIFFLANVIALLISAFLGIENNKKKKILITVIWIVFVLLIPELVKYYYYKEAKGIIKCRYIHESKKADFIMKVDKDAFSKAKIYPFKEQKFKAYVENAKKYKEKDSKELNELENRLITLLKAVLKKYQLISAITIMTFFDSTGWEISTNGYNGYLNFRQYILVKQNAFRGYIMDKLYIEAPNYGPIISFQKEEEHIFHCKSTLPGSFLIGAIWHLMQMFLLMFINCRKFNKVMFRDESKRINSLELTIKEGEINILLTGYNELKQHLFNFFAGKEEFKGELKINTSKEVEGREFLFLYKKEEMDADLSPNELKMLLNEPGDETENWKIIFNHAKRTGKILLMIDFVDGLKKSERKEILNFIKKEKLLALLITNNQELALRLVPGDKIMLMPGDDSIEIIDEE